MAAPKKLRITYFAAKGVTESWNLIREMDNLHLSVGATFLRRLIEGMQGILQGQGDYSIGGPGDETLLWFWWQPRNVA